jgi:hypothetical protein
MTLLQSAMRDAPAAVQEVEGVQAGGLSSISSEGWSCVGLSSSAMKTV